VKKIHWLDQIQHESRSHRNGLWIPRSHREASVEDPSFPKCELCGYDILDRYQVEDTGPTWVEIRGWHHGAEDTHRIEFDFHWGDGDFMRAMNALVLFRVDHIEDTAKKR
jgi:hypothetical protein